MTDKTNRYFCLQCNFLTTNKTNWRQHLTTNKHYKNSLNSSNKAKKSQKYLKNGEVKNTTTWHICDLCNKNTDIKVDCPDIRRNV